MGKVTIKGLPHQWQTYLFALLSETFSAECLFLVDWGLEKLANFHLLTCLNAISSVQILELFSVTSSTCWNGEVAQTI